MARKKLKDINDFWDRFHELIPDDEWDDLELNEISEDGYKTRVTPIILQMKEEGYRLDASSLAMEGQVDLWFKEVWDRSTWELVAREMWRKRHDK